MTRVVEASPQVLVMRNPKTETKQQFMARAEKLADELYVEPEPEVIAEPEPETVPVTVRELSYLRWFFQNADFGPVSDRLRAHLNARYVREGGVIPEGYSKEE